LLKSAKPYFGKLPKENCKMILTKNNGEPMIIKDRTFDEERALYNLTDAQVTNCIFDGAADGESALKECRGTSVYGCQFALRYPLWHGVNVTAENCVFTTTCRAAMWYDDGADFSKCEFNGIKAFRECRNVKITDSSANSPEFGWKCDKIVIDGGKYSSEYFLFASKNVEVKNVSFTGKYSFQYVKNAVICDSVLDTKDAFWHAENVTVKNCVVKGEYLAWFSKNVTFIDCEIYGTQPLCYCKKLKLINCKMIGCDLAFEYSDVKAVISGTIDSVKNPKSGKIQADNIGETVTERSVFKNRCKIITANK